MATKRSSSSQSQVVLKAIFLFHFHFCHPAQSRPSMAENRAGGDEEPEEAVMAVVVGATCPPLPLVRPPPYRRKVVVKVGVHDGQDKRRAMEAVSSFKGIDTISVDLKDKKLTVIGRIDPVRLTRKLRKHYHAEILSIRSEKEEEKKEEPEKSEEKEEGAEKNKEAGAVASAWNGYDPFVLPHYVPITEEDPNGCVKVVVKLNILDEKEQRNAMRAVSDLKGKSLLCSLHRYLWLNLLRVGMKSIVLRTGIHTISADLKDKKLTVIGNIDPVSVVIKLRKHYLTEIVTVDPAT
ncbi:unnamed protein product [Musa acuminata subsp. malaccensis]|uniref:(wild Malaysian banana) hypothetical protein n=1 Tax=Musa acuminata subsp. malaccensis TaxID=214687 RepID=A0A804I9J6_MUSAM|nr:unnamed protein product [Musa acuminata subsp. malaccensis]